MAEDNTFSHLVVIGASAGGIEALSRLVSTLPEDLSAPIVIAQQLDPERAGRLEQILSRSSTLPVRTITGPVTGVWVAGRAYPSSRASRCISRTSPSASGRRRNCWL